MAKKFPVIVREVGLSLPLNRRHAASFAEFLKAAQVIEITGKFSVMIETLLYVLGSCERHPELTEEMHIPLRPIPQEDFLGYDRNYSVCFGFM